MDPKIREYLSHIGRKGGIRRWQNAQLNKEERSALMKRVRRGKHIHRPARPSPWSRPEKKP